MLRSVSRNLFLPNGCQACQHADTMMSRSGGAHQAQEVRCDSLDSVSSHRLKVPAPLHLLEELCCAVVQNSGSDCVVLSGTSSH